MTNEVYVKNNIDYDREKIFSYLDGLELFNDTIKEGDVVLIKPNWVKESHLSRSEDWDYIITHPSVIEAVIEAAAKRLKGKGKIIVADGPQTDSSFEKILEHMNVDNWYSIADSYNIKLEILDLREQEWKSQHGNIVSRRELAGKSKESIEMNMQDDISEFYGHKKSKYGYFGASPDLAETNMAHDGVNNLYRVSKTAIECDVFINLPKLKTHRKAGITCALKNLVGITTYRNYLPHHTEGTPGDHGDQFKDNNLKNKVEERLMRKIKNIIKDNMWASKAFVPFKKAGGEVFGKTTEVVRSGNWYGNDTIWRTVLDLNKILLYANSDCSMREDKWVNSKRYIGIVDGIRGGEGIGSYEPDPIDSKLIIAGTNPVAIDCCSAKLMGFDYMKIPLLYNAFKINRYKICDFNYEDIVIYSDDNRFNKYLKDISKEDVLHFRPHFGWKNHIELE